MVLLLLLPIDDADDDNDMALSVDEANEGGLLVVVVDIIYGSRLSANYCSCAFWVGVGGV